MSEPVTTYRSLIVPNTGDLAGAWGTSALNPNFQMVDGMFGSVATISLSGATTILLTSASTSGIWLGSLPQCANAMLRFTGAQTGAAVIQFPTNGLGYYIIDNQCTGTSYIQLSPTGGGKKIGVPYGRKTHVFFDGTDLDYVNMPEVGAALDLQGWSALPAWMTACTFSPYLIKDGATYSASVYPQLFQALGSTFGGNGITTFAVPDERARARIALDTIQAASGATSARITFPIGGFTASIMGAAGGDQRMQTHTHGITDPTHAHAFGFPVYNGAGSSLPPVASNATGGIGTYTGTTNNSATGITINAVGSGASQNIPPSIVSFLPLIKT